MTRRFTRTLALSGALALSLIGAARADCEADLNSLEQAYKTPALSPQAKSYLDEAKTTAVTALKHDDDGACHKAIAVAMSKAGLPFK